MSVSSPNISPLLDWAFCDLENWLDTNDLDTNDLDRTRPQKRKAFERACERFKELPSDSDGEDKARRLPLSKKTTLVSNNAPFKSVSKSPMAVYDQVMNLVEENKQLPLNRRYVYKTLTQAQEYLPQQKAVCVFKKRVPVDISFPSASELETAGFFQIGVRKNRVIYGHEILGHHKENIV